MVGVTSFALSLADAIEQDYAYYEPVEWCQERAGIHLWSKQREIVRSVEQNKKTAVVSAHATGKSLVSAALACWWIDTHPVGEAFVVTTAPSKAQIHAILWEEIRAIHRKAGMTGRVQLSDNWLIGETLVGMGRKPQDYSESAFQGIHRKYVLVILDESGGIDEWLWNAAETITTSDQCRILAIGNPDDPSSHFASVANPGSTWQRHFISVFDSPNFTGEQVPPYLNDVLVTRNWVDDKRHQWGEESALWISKIEGRFPEIDEFAVVPLSWVNKANERWQERQAEDDYTVWGVDIARFGADKSVIAKRVGNYIEKLESFTKLDTRGMTERVKFRMQEGDSAVIDVVGLGAGVFDNLAADGFEVEGFNAGERTDVTDQSGELAFSNVRSAAWWNVREMLDPNNNPTLALPPEEMLTADLIAPRWKPTAGGKIQIESKDEIRKRIGRSTDYGDAVIQSLWVEMPQPESSMAYSFAWTDPSDSEILDAAVGWGEDIPPMELW